MTAMNLYLADATRSTYLAQASLSTRVAQAKTHDVDQRVTVGKSGSYSRLLEEIVQVAKGVLTPINTTRATLGDNLSRDMGLR